MRIEIDDDFADEMVASAIIESYIAAKQMYKAATKKKNPAFMHPDDIVMYGELIPALEIVGGWYCYDFKKKVKQREKDGI